MRTSCYAFLEAWAIAFSLVLVCGCGPTNQLATPPPPEVTVAHPVTRDIADSIEFVGTTRATATVDLKSRVNGYLEKINFEDGADVVANQELFLIEQAPYIAALDSAKAAVQKAKAELQLAQSQYARMAPLVSQRAITQDELDIQAAQVETAKADVAAAEAALQTAELNLQYTVIRAPIAGHIGRHLVDIGNLIQAEQTSLAQIQSIDPIYVYFDVSERDLLRFMEMISSQQLPDPDKNPPVLNLGLADEPNFPHQGKLDFRELGIDPSTGTALRRGVFPNPNRQLLPGMFVRIRAQVGDPVPRLMVEERAIGADQRGSFLLTVNDKNEVEYRPVRLGIASGGMRVVEEGVKATDWVIVNGLQRARPGATVNPQQTEMASSTAASSAEENKPADK
jgi:RND family efflux transporter MFP subunit